jgi:hypothetical protein
MDFNQGPIVHSWTQKPRHGGLSRQLRYYKGIAVCATPDGLCRND